MSEFSSVHGFSLPLPFGTAASNHALSVSHTVLSYTFPEIHLWFASHYVIVPMNVLCYFYIHGCKITNTCLWRPSHCFYFDDPQVYQTAHLELNLLSSQACLFVFVFSFIRVVSQHIFIYCLLWSRQCSRHQGFKVEKWTWPWRRFLLGLFTPIAYFIKSAWT